MCTSKALERLDPFSAKISTSQAYLHLLRYNYAVNVSYGVILDVGCGYGYGSKMLTKVGDMVVAIDISREALQYAKKCYRGPAYIQADAERLPFREEKFDCVVALELIEHVENGKNLLSEVYRVIKKDGLLILSTPNVAHFSNRLKHVLFHESYRQKNPKNPYHKYEYAYAELVMLLKFFGFKIEKASGQIITFPFPFAHKLPLHIYINMGHLLPSLSQYVIYKSRKK